MADGVADAWDNITTTTVAGTAVAAPPRPDLSDYDAAKAWLWRSMATAAGTAAAVDAISSSGGSPGSGSGPGNYLPQCGYACVATLGTGAGGVATVTATPEQLRQQYWSQEVNERANTKAPRPDLNTTVREAAKSLWKAANDPGNDIDLGTVGGGDNQQDERYTPERGPDTSAAPAPVPPGTTPKKFRKQGCGKGWKDYGDVLKNGNRTGVRACLTSSDIGQGQKVREWIKPPGYGGRAQKHDKGHLLAKKLGGTGEMPENFVTVYQSPNRGRMRVGENEVANALETQDVYYTSTPIYRNGDPIPYKIMITARGTKGLAFTIPVENTPS